MASKTYQQAKDIYNNAALLISDTIDCDNIANFRKHLTEFEYRQKKGKEFLTRIIDNQQLLVMRIK